VEASPGAAYGSTRDPLATAGPRHLRALKEHRRRRGARGSIGEIVNAPDPGVTVERAVGCAMPIRMVERGCTSGCRGYLA